MCKIYNKHLIFLDAKECESQGCNAYSCFEDTAHCGKDGYLIAFGLKYCKRFQEKGLFKKKKVLVITLI